MAWTVSLALLGSIVIYFANGGADDASAGGSSSSYIDALYWASTAQFVVGLVPGNIQSLPRSAQTTMWLLAIFGSPIFMSLIPVLIRRRAYRKVLEREFGITRAGKTVETITTDSGPDAITSSDGNDGDNGGDGGNDAADSDDDDDDDAWDTFEEYHPSSRRRRRRYSRQHSLSPSAKSVQVAEHLDLWKIAKYRMMSVQAFSPDPADLAAAGGQDPSPLPPSPPQSVNNDFRMRKIVVHDAAKSPQQHATIPLHQAPNRAIEKLKENLIRRPSNTSSKSVVISDKHLLEQVGGVEYRALQALQIIIPVYYFGMQLIGFFVIRSYLALRPAMLADISRKVSPWWFSAFNSVSLFNQVGITLLDDGGARFGTEPALLAFLCIPMIIGHTGFPAMLRTVIAGLEWMARKRGNRASARVYRYLLRYPRRCFTLLFDRRQTLLLVASLVFLNLLQFACSMALDFRDKAFDGVSPFVHFFQSIATRNCGVQVVAFAGLHPAMLWVYVGMMYLSSTYPLSVTMRSTSNPTPPGTGDGDKKPANEGERGYGGGGAGERKDDLMDTSSVAQMRRLMLNDIVWIFCLIFLILVFENRAVERGGSGGQDTNAAADAASTNPHPKFTIFALVFEVVSAYGNVGYSIGSPDAGYSLSGEWTTASKLAIVVAMILGRHRGLPRDVDQTVRLPTRKIITRTRVIDRETGHEVGKGKEGVDALETVTMGY
ncbi:low affinity potassium transporter [Geranomyces michiganensis]|nr:low affinity potassium transporter [Geranomyces michiganensis]